MNHYIEYSNITLDVQRPVRWSQIVQRNQQHINQRPNAQSTEAEQLPDSFLPVPQEEPIHPESTERDAQNQRRRPAITLRPVARNLLHKCPMAHTENLPIYGAVGFELRINRIATALLFAGLLPPLGLVAIAAQGFTLHLRSAGSIRWDTADGGLGTASYIDFRSVNALRIVLAIETGIWQIAAQGFVGTVTGV